MNSTNNPSITSTNAQKIITIPKPNVEPNVAPACSYSFWLEAIISEALPQDLNVITSIKRLKRIKSHLKILPKKLLLGFLNLAPQDGQSKALSLTEWLHSGQFIKGIHYSLKQKNCF